MIDTTSSLYDLEEASCERIFKMPENRLIDATLTALKTGNLSPLVKEELKYTIQSRRLATGKQELKVDFPVQLKYNLTEEEKDKIKRRREQNRLAAQRFRDRRKLDADLICKHIKTLENENIAKKIELERLQEEKSQLQRMLQEHLLVCHRVYNPDVI